MTAQSGLGFSGIVAIQIPDQGATDFVLTKLSPDNYDYDWLAGGGGASTIIIEDEGVPVGVPADTLDFVGAGVTVTGAGTTKTITIPGGGGSDSLQDAYDFATAPPQIVVNGTPDPVTIDASVAGDVFAVRGVSDEDLIRLSTTGGSLFGGVNASNILNLQGSQAANRGTVNIHGTSLIDFDWTSDIGTYAIRWANTIPSSGAAVVGLLQVQNVITIDAGTFISSTVDDFSDLRWTATPGFAVQTLFFARPQFRSTSVGIAPSQSFIYAAQAQYHITGAGSITVPTYRALSFAPIIRVDNAGDEVHLTNTVGVTLQPLFNTRNATAVADYGTIRGVHMFNASVVLFGLGIGSEIATNWIGLDVEALTGLVVSGVRAAVRSAIPSGASNFVILNTGGAQSDFGSGDIHLDDDTSIVFGNTVAAPDAGIFFDGTHLTLDTQLSGPNASKVRVVHGLIVEADIFPVSDFIRRAASTTLLLSSWRLTGLTSGDMADGFGTALFWSIEDDAAVRNNIAFQSAERAGADNTGLYRLRVYTAGVANQIYEASGLTFTVTARARVEGVLAVAPISPAQITTDEDDYQGQGSGTAMRGVLRLSTDASRTITGIDATTVDFSEPDDMLWLINIGSFDLVLGHQDVGSAAANRIISPTGVDLILGPDDSALLWYDGATLRWRILETTGA